jgi:hypothetical protein
VAMRSTLLSVISALLLVVSLLATITLVWSISRGQFDKSPVGAICGSVLVFLGYVKQFIEQKGDRKPDRRTRRIGFIPPAVAKSFRLAPSFKSGIYGGLIGGGLSGLIIGVAYYIQSTPREALWLVDLLQVFIFASMVGAIIGASSQFAILWFRHLAVEKHYWGFFFNEVWGGGLGGLIGGTLAGLFAGYFFGTREQEAVEMSLLLWGSITGSILLVVSVVFYEYQGRLRNVIGTLLSSLVIAPFLVGLASLAIWALGVDLETYDWKGATGAGGLLGAIIGCMLGLEIGLVLRVDRLWKVASE